MEILMFSLAFLGMTLSQPNCNLNYLAALVCDSNQLTNDYKMKVAYSIDLVIFPGSENQTQRRIEMHGLTPTIGVMCVKGRCSVNDPATGKSLTVNSY